MRMRWINVGKDGNKNYWRTAKRWETREIHISLGRYRAEETRTIWCMTDSGLWVLHSNHSIFFEEYNIHEKSLRKEEKIHDQTKEGLTPII